ncbi:MAG: hypothetical protein HOL01_05095 [Planctomycetaceae bacterium]|nr:hypothetical protein [Planctomycetaceae bacterium]MBT6493909.1 hypothetical protein [Planctomycetaceae bacterium]
MTVVIELRCPACKQNIKLDESFTGRRIACVGCAKEFTVPDAKQLAARKAARQDKSAAQATGAKSSSPAMSVAMPAQPEQTLLDKAKRYRDQVVGGLVVGVLAIAAFVMYTAMQGENGEDDNSARVGGDGSQPNNSVAATDTGENSSSTNENGGERPGGTGQSNSTTRNGAENGNANPKPTTGKTANGGKPSTSTNKKPQVDQPVKQEITSAKYTSTSGVLLRQSAELGDWITVTHDSAIPAGTQIALPSAFDARLDVGSKLYAVRLVGGAVSQLLEASDEIPFGFELQRGRLIIEGRRDSDVPGAVLSLAVRGERWRVELLEGNTVLGVEISPRRPEKFEQDFGDDVFQGGILVVKGSVRIVDGAGRTRVVAGNSWLSLAKRDRINPESTEADQLPGRLPEPQFRALPDWLDLDKLAVATKSNPDAELFSGSFNRQQEFAEAIIPLRASTDERAVALAVECQAMLGQRAALIDALANTKHAEVRKAAIDGLRDQMPTSNDERTKLKAELAEAFDKGGNAIYSLLWGYADEDVRKNQFICNQLVFWLMHEELVIRELAWTQITAHATARYAYKPEAPVRSRRLTTKQWQQHVLKTGSILGEEL